MRLSKIFLFTGGSFAILLALIVKYSYHSEFLQVVFYSVSLGSLLGITITVFANVLKLPQIPNGWDYFRNASILLIISFIVAIISYDSLARFPLGNWHKLPDPPEPMQEFELRSKTIISDGNVLVRSEDGDLYFIPCSAGHPCEWEKVDGIPTDTEVGYWPCHTETTKYPPEPQLEGRIQDIIQYKVCGIDFVIIQSYAIDEHGDLFIHNRWFRPNVELNVFPLTIVVALISSIPGNFFIKKKTNFDEKADKSA